MPDRQPVQSPPVQSHARGAGAWQIPVLPEGAGLVDTHTRPAGHSAFPLQPMTQKKPS
jgi:hypothetical protein